MYATLKQHAPSIAFAAQSHMICLCAPMSLVTFVNPRWVSY